MKDKMIEIKGAKYPLRATMGALVRFKQLTGFEVADMMQKPGDTQLMCAYWFCLIAAACNADDIDFPYSFDKFCDILTPEIVADLNAKLNEEEGSEEKKTARKKNA